MTTKSSGPAGGTIKATPTTAQCTWAQGAETLLLPSEGQGGHPGDPCARGSCSELEYVLSGEDRGASAPPSLIL